MYIQYSRDRYGVTFWSEAEKLHPISILGVWGILPRAQACSPKQQRGNTPYKPKADGFADTA